MKRANRSRAILLASVVAIAPTIWLGSGAAAQSAQAVISDAAARSEATAPQNLSIRNQRAMSTSVISAEAT
jgi:anaerobic C4-dicarboxylate transporter